MEYIHYGHNKFSKEQFEPIKNREEFIKPNGGLWASRVETNHGWKQWCEQAEWKDRLKKSFTFTLKQNAKILTITSLKQLKDLPRAKSDFMARVYTVLDFEELAKQYDAIEILISKDIELHWQLYGWDCDSILIMNPEIIEEIDK